MNRRFVRLFLLLSAAAMAASCNDISAPVDLSRATAAPILGNHAFTELALGDFHSCGLQANGEAFCWGTNSKGQSGNGLSGDENIGSPLVVIGGFIFSSLTAGGAHTCGVLTSGASACWGNNVVGQLGVASNQDKFEPTQVAGEHRFTSISASTATHTCALDDTGAAWCWGENEWGRLGDGTETARNAPVAVSGGLTFASISSGGGHTCALTTDGTAYCWGYNVRGQVGDGTDINRLVPVTVATPLKFSMIKAGLTHTCALTTDNLAYCWGDNVAAALGDGTFDPKNTPVPVEGGNQFVTITLGERHACGLTPQGIALCWGYNQYGALGDGTFITRTEPVPISLPISFKRIAAGAYHTCGISTSNVTYCWGNNEGHQLGAQ
jgi:alpha-tubulin suppressor-like RCC1 family protein